MPNLRRGRLSPARAGLLALAAGLLLAAALLGHFTPLRAQTDDAAAPAATGASGVSLRVDDLVDRITYAIVDRFEVQLANLDAATTYKVVVASSNVAALGIGACGTAAQTATASGVTSQNQYFIVYACGVGVATVTAEVRRAGAESAEVTVSQRVTVQPIPDFVPADQRPAAGAAGAVGGVARVGTPGIVPNVRFDSITTTSFRAQWDKPADGGRTLTGYGVLRRQQGQAWPPYRDADVVSGRSKTYRGLSPNTTYEVRVHACNGPDSCGWWTGGASVTTRPQPTVTPTPTATTTAAPVGPPGAPDMLSATSRTATAFTVTWRAPATTGGAPLTGFGILRWAARDPRPPDRDAAVVGAATRSRSFTGLTYGRAQQVRIRACNGPSRCSAWASLTVPALPPPLPSISLPTTTIAIGERLSVGANDVPTGAVAYLRVEGPIQPQGRCGAGASGADAVGAAPSPSTGLGYYDSMWIEGCAPGGDDAVVRLESADGSVRYDRRTLTVAAAARPGQVARPTVSARDGALHVDWEAPTSGGPPTHYDVWHRAGTSGAWTQAEVRGRTSTTITGLTNGASYQVQVRAANTTGDGDWSAIVTGTPNAALGEPPETSPPGAAPSPPSCDSLPQSPPPVPSSLDAPTNLDLTPALTTRHAQLAWAPVSGAAKYKVEIRRLEQGRWGAWGAPDLSGSSSNSGEVTNATCYDINLDHIVQMLSDRGLANSTRGLGTNVAFGFQVKAINGVRESDFSNEVIVIDFSRAYANGDSRGYPVDGQGQAEISWQRADQVLGSDYSSGQYSFRYRELRHRSGPGAGVLIHHSDPDWQPNAYVTIDTTTDNPKTGLTLGTIYGVQIRLDNTGPGGTTSVYAARDIYAWPHHESAYYRQHVVATHVFEWPPISRATSSDAIVYKYRICTDTFTFPAYTKPGATMPYKAGDPAQWVAYINHALRQWQYATNGLVRMMHEVDAQGNSLPCSSTLEFLEEIAKEYNRRKGQGESDSAIDTHIPNLLESLKDKGIKGRRLGNALATDLKLSEILMIDNVTGPTATLANRVFDDVSEHVGIPLCTSGCAVSEVHVDPDDPHGNPIRTSDIYLNRLSHWHQYSEFLNLTGVEQIRLNTCPNTKPENREEQYNRPYGTLVHEAGHALGLDHPTNLGPVMSYTPGVPRCSPHPFDVLALMALYQSRGERRV